MIYGGAFECAEKVRHTSRGTRSPWIRRRFLTKPAAIPPVSRPCGRGSWYKNQAHVPLSVPKAFGTLPGGPSPPGYAAWFLMKPASIPPVSRPGGRGSWYKNQAHVLIFMIMNFIYLLKWIFLQSSGRDYVSPLFLFLPTKRLSNSFGMVPPGICLICRMLQNRLRKQYHCCHFPGTHPRVYIL